MTIAPEQPLLSLPPEPVSQGSWKAVAEKWRDPSGLKRLAVALGAYVGCLIVFGLFVLTQSKNPFSVYNSIIHSAFLSSGSLAEVLVRSVPIVLAALAVSVPARAGLVNVGGEGQLIMGAVAATGFGVALGHHVPGPVGWLIMAIGGIVAGAVWAGIAGVLRVAVGANEAVTTLLLNFIANDIMLYLLYQPWKDPSGGGQPESRPLTSNEVLPKIFGSSINLGVIIALVVAFGVYVLVKRTGWGFALRVVGGNQVAASRAGIPVTKLMISSMMVGGGLAGLGGMLYLAGTQVQLLPGGTLSYGYIAFLAAFLGRHDPFKVVLSALLFSAIAIGVPGLQLNFGLDGNVVDVLLALIVMAPLGTSVYRKQAF
ncbi:MAG TPA: ABC transporter permease [Acidimicrobiales bacterium]|jgi:simple sugar transport system permease protein|nr:ABC transporter permease [Acidimicrobiales bacterium]